jgi:hypothetical protein
MFEPWLIYTYTYYQCLFITHIEHQSPCTTKFNSIQVYLLKYVAK